uniref:Uncharacterized protein n=1 Tax=Rhizophagus irregularis (strain DAOM 181602 / DAOM 197198 / MUCL 43194) TaxID=747089 RepID=U9UEY8_RHIID
MPLHYHRSSGKHIPLELGSRRWFDELYNIKKRHDAKEKDKQRALVKQNQAKMLDKHMTLFSERRTRLGNKNLTIQIDTSIPRKWKNWNLNLNNFKLNYFSVISRNQLHYNNKGDPRTTPKV